MIYAEMDIEILQFQSRTSLQCPAGCGKCCKSDRVEAAVIELVPLANEIFRKGEAPFWHEKAFEADDKGTCLFFVPDQADATKGRCKFYAWRPSMCRLFGFSAEKNKKNQNDLIICEHQKKTFPETAAQARQSVAQGLHVPGIAEYHLRLFGLSSDNRLMPINMAIRVALEKFGLWIQMVQAQQTGEAIRTGIVYSVTAAGISMLMKKPPDVTKP